MKLKLRYNEGCQPVYMTAGSSHCDLFSRAEVLIPAGTVRPVPTGVWIASFEPEDLTPQFRAELQIRCRSSFPIKRSLMLANGVGTVDVDYPDEIQALIYNFGGSDCLIGAGERVAQLSLSTVHTIVDAKGSDQARIGGFGSTGK
jgi:deoxyuridine 5'-triphosphate nucleotidohydrolase